MVGESNATVTGTCIGFACSGASLLSILLLNYGGCFACSGAAHSCYITTLRFTLLLIGELAGERENEQLNEQTNVRCI